MDLQAKGISLDHLDKQRKLFMKERKSLWSDLLTVTCYTRGKWSTVLKIFQGKKMWDKDFISSKTDFLIWRTETIIINRQELRAKSRTSTNHKVPVFPREGTRATVLSGLDSVGKKQRKEMGCWTDLRIEGTLTATWRIYQKMSSRWSKWLEATTRGLEGRWNIHSLTDLRINEG